MCEIREWIKRGYTTLDRQAVLEKMIARHRGKDAAKLLIKRINWYLSKTKG